MRILPPTYFCLFLVVSIVLHLVVPIKTAIPTPLYVIGDRVIYVNAVWQRLQSSKPVHSTSVTDSVGPGSTGHVP